MITNKSLKKILITGGMAIALLAPIALSTITPNSIMPTNTITVQAKRRHHHHKHHSYRRYKIAVSAKRARRMKRREIRRIKRELRHTHKHSFWHEVLEAKLHRVRRTKAFAIYRR